MSRGVGRRTQGRGAASAPRSPTAKRGEVLRKAHPVLARLIDARPDFRPRAISRAYGFDHALTEVEMVELSEIGGRTGPLP
jgi:hypothetical protein